MDSINKYSIHIIVLMLIVSMAVVGYAFFGYTQTPSLFDPPFDFVPDETGAITSEGWPIYETENEAYCLNDLIFYQPVARINAVPYVLEPNFTLVTAENDGRFDVCHFGGAEDYPRNITRGFDGDLPLTSVRNAADCSPKPPPGFYYIEAVVSADVSMASAYLAGPFVLQDCNSRKTGNTK